MPFAALSQDVACEALRGIGVEVAESELRIEAREERWLVRLPDQRLAWFAASARGRRKLEIERGVLRLLAERCTFSAPRVLRVGENGELDVRSMVPGDDDPWRTFAEVCASDEIGRTLGTAIGSMLAEQHTAIRVADVTGWLPRRPSWPESAAWIGARLPSVIDDQALIDRANAIIDKYERVTVTDAECALVHCDLGLHNVGIDASTRHVHGIFDYEEAAWADRHHDFRYLVFDRDRYALFDAAIAAYEPITGHRIQRERVLLYNAACAVTFLALRIGIKPEARSCGRTLEEDLRWSSYAIAQVLGP